MTIGDDTITLSSGRTFYANHSMIGLHADEDQSECPGSLGEGADGGINTNDWTHAERVELAEFMIARWQAWRDRKPTA